MRATDILKAEHRNIEGVLSALEAAASAVESGAEVRPGFFADAAEFISGYADGCHHHKEEEVLFEAMVENGMPKHQGPIGVMLGEHEQARAFTKAMREGAARWAEGDEQARNQTVHAARGYAALLREHIAKEDTVLFPMADTMLPSGVQATVSSQVETIDRDEESNGTHERLLALAAALTREASA